MPSHAMSNEEKQSFIEESEELKAFLSSHLGMRIMAILTDKVALTVSEMANPKKCGTIQELGVHQGMVKGLKYLDTQLRVILRKAEEMKKDIIEKANDSG